MEQKTGPGLIRTMTLKGEMWGPLADVAMAAEVLAHDGCDLFTFAEMLFKKARG